MKRAIKKNKESEIDVDVTDMDLLGFGEAEFETMTLKIPGGTIGDRLSVSVVHKSPHQPVAWCDVHVVHKRGAFFQTPACPHAWPVNGRCGGCPLLHVNFEKAAELKQQKVVHALDENGCRAKVHWNPSPSRRNYRNRGHFVVAKQGGQTILGAYAPRSHDVVSMKNCLVLQAPMERVATDMERIFSSSRYPVYPEEKGIRYVTIRADKDGAVWVDLVVHSNGAYLEDCVEKISRLAAVKGISLSVNAQSGNAMRCGGSTTLWGEPHLEEHVNGVRLLMSASSFSQLNREVMAAMYISAGKLIKTTPAVIWDLYCGVGGLGLTASKKYPHVRLFGADFVDEAMVSARINASNAQIDAHFEAFDLTKGLPSGWERPDVVLLNPPRRGVDAVVKQALTSILPSEIVYMSCNPETFASDVAEFSAAGYSLSDVYAHDMLPFTSHIEVIAALRTAS